MYKMLTEDQQTGVGYYDYGGGGEQKIQEGNFDSRRLILEQLPTFGLDPRWLVTITLQN